MQFLSQIRFIFIFHIYSCEKDLVSFISCESLGILSEQERGVKSAGNIRIWAESHIRKVAKEIIGQIKTASKTVQGIASIGQLCKRVKYLFIISRKKFL